MATNRITNFNFDNGEYYSANLEDGSIRVGMNGLCHLQVPSSHAEYTRMSALTLDTIEAFIDGMVSIGRIQF